MTPQDDGSGRRVPGPWSRTFGELSLTWLPDGSIEIVPLEFLTGSSAADWESRPELRDADGHLTAGAGTLVVERGGHRLLIDAGLGPVHQGRDETPSLFGAMGGGDLPASLAAAGVDPAGVDAVAFTHLHVDHVGWAAPWAVEDGRGLFPAATWLVGRGEPEGPHRTDDLVLAGEADRLREVDDGEEVLPGMRCWSLPGHTSGHVAWVLDTGDGRRVVAFGDAVHSPAQIEHPEWTVAVDSDQDAAERSRRALVEYLATATATADVIGFGVHFADRQLGRVVDGRWEQA